MCLNTIPPFSRPRLCGPRVCRQRQGSSTSGKPYLGEGKAGYVHTLAKEYEVDGTKFIRTTVELRLTVKRFSDTIEMAADTGTTETADGIVTGTFMRQYQARQQQTQIDGVVKGRQLHLTLNGKTALKPAPWNSEVLGLYKQERLFKDRELTPGSKFTFLSFEPVINYVLKTESSSRANVRSLLKELEEKEKLTLVEVIPEKVSTSPAKKCSFRFVKCGSTKARTRQNRGPTSPAWARS